jgi:hypothetical protein
MKTIIGKAMTTDGRITYGSPLMSHITPHFKLDKEKEMGNSRRGIFTLLIPSTLHPH